MQRTDIAALAPIITQAAQEGCPAAKHICTRCGRDAAEMVIAVHRRVFRPSEPAECCLVGGLAGQEGPVKDALIAAIRQSGV